MSNSYRHLKPKGLGCIGFIDASYVCEDDDREKERDERGKRMSIYRHTSTIGEPRCDGLLCGFLWQISHAHEDTGKHGCTYVWKW